MLFPRRDFIKMVFKDHILFSDHHLNKSAKWDLKDGILSIWEIGIKQVMTAYINNPSVKKALEQGKPILFQYKGKTRLLIYNKADTNVQKEENETITQEVQKGQFGNPIRTYTKRIFTENLKKGISRIHPAD